jgi:hypothetical protein
MGTPFLIFGAPPPPECSRPSCPETRGGISDRRTWEPADGSAFASMSVWTGGTSPTSARTPTAPLPHRAFPGCSKAHPPARHHADRPAGTGTRDGPRTRLGRRDRLEPSIITPQPQVRYNVSLRGLGREVRVRHLGDHGRGSRAACRAAGMEGSPNWFTPRDFRMRSEGRSPDGGSRPDPWPRGGTRSCGLMLR